uniref:DUF4760 domain-containing protein n=1 Tax=viral metagenome TaxID=1070528 RepID=A0A6C0KPV9_9ZZZZ
MNFKLFYIVYLIFFIFLVAIYFVWKTNIHKYPKFEIILKVLTALTILFTSFAIIINIYTFSITQSDSEVKIYQDVFDNLIVNTVILFQNNPKMQYLFDEMFEPLHYNHGKPILKRYYSDEEQIVMIILHKISSVVYYLKNDQSLNDYDKSIIENKLYLFVKNMISSTIFMENYNNLKSRFPTALLNEYFKNNFNI